MLPESEAEHIRKSLRMQPGDEIVLFNGERKYNARLTRVTKECVLAEITSMDDPNVAALNQVTLFPALIRAANFELVIQKATELGVNNIVPLQSEFSQIKLERIETKLERWRKISLEACKQSERGDLVDILDPIQFEELSNSGLFENFDLILFCTVPRLITNQIAEVQPIANIADRIKQAKHVALLIGPEGGFSPTEHQLAKEWGLPFVSLGISILKAETASIAALSFVKLLQS